MSTSQKIGAFFDFDGTLLKADSEALIIKYLWNAGELSVIFYLKMGIVYLLYKLHLYPELRMQEMAQKIYKGQKLETFESLAEDFYFKELKPLLADNVVNQLKEHQKLGHVVVLVSASFRFYLTYAVKDLGIDHLLCTDLEVGKDGILTGLFQGKQVRGPQKAAVTKKLASQHNIDLDQSYAYGDHITDLPILQLVGYPVAVEPIHELQEIAKLKKWKILQFE